MNLGNTTTMDVEYYKNLRYPVQLTRHADEQEEYWLAEVLDLPGCMSDGATPNEAMESLEDAKELWIAAHLEDGYEVPEPTDAREYSGRFVLFGFPNRCIGVWPSKRSAKVSALIRTS